MTFRHPWCRVVQSAPTALEAMTDRIRLTVSITPETHEVFSSMAEAAGISLGRCIGDWLADTSEGAVLVSQQMQRARRAPVTVMREMQAALHGAHGEATALLDDFRAGRAPGTAARSAAVPGGPAPSGNTGRKSPGRGAPRGRKA